MTIRLTENKLKRMIKESIRKHLNEGVTDNGISVSNKKLEQRLRNGENIKDVFDYVDPSVKSDLTFVGKDKKYNFINKNGEIISKQWFDDEDEFNEGYLRVCLNDKWNFIDEHGNYLFNQWFDDADNFYEGYAIVKLNGKWNYIDENGNYLFKQWFDYACGFYDDDFYDHSTGLTYARVKLNNKEYYVNNNGEMYYENYEGRLIRCK